MHGIDHCLLSILVVVCVHCVGILLGPSAFGQIPGFSKSIFPPASLITLKLFADVGLIFFMFFLGLEVTQTHNQAHNTQHTTKQHSITPPQQHIGRGPHITRST